MNKIKKISGFTLMEVMITVVIIGILAAIAYPSYVDQMKRVRRSDGHTALLNMATSMEHYFSQYNTYIGATPQTLGISETSAEGFYTLSIENLSSTTYTLKATAKGLQSNDTACSPLSLTQTNLKGPDPNSCW